MTDKTEFQSAYDLGAAKKLDLVTIQGIEHALIPEGAKVASFENLLPAPTRIKAHPSFTDVASFHSYIESFKEDGSRIFIDEQNLRFFTVFDCHKKDQPRWGDHSASFQAKPAREWERFKSFDGKKLSQMEFAEFIEDNVTYITKPISGVDLLAMAQTIKVQVKGNIEIDETLHGGIKTLSIKDDSIVRGTSSKDKQLSFPEKVTLAIRVFHNHTAYQVEVFLRYRKQDNSLVFWIKIPDPKAIEELAFNAVIADIQAATKLPTLKGSYQGLSHK